MENFFIFKVHKGIRGFIFKSDSTPLEGALVSVEKIQNGGGMKVLKNVTSFDNGDYWRLLLPGRYSVAVTYPG